MNVTLVLQTDIKLKSSKDDNTELISNQMFSEKKKEKEKLMVLVIIKTRNLQKIIHISTLKISQTAMGVIYLKLLHNAVDYCHEKSDV